MFLSSAHLAITGFLCCALSAFAQDPAATPTPLPTEPSLIQGEVTANDVYVRSGDSTNHYTVCKLNAGNIVTIISERGEWYEIVPPPGTFSLVSGDYVDTANGQTGIVNGDNVRVRAGSLLNDNKYTVQSMLNKGETVTILGRNPDGFLKIEPPAGATLWISKAYVRATGTPPVSSASPAADAPERNVEAPAVPGALLASPAVQTEGPRSKTLPVARSTQWMAQLGEIDVLAKTEVAKPANERDFGEVLSRYLAVAAQNEDDYARQYAAARVEEIKTMKDLADAISKVRELGEEAEVKRREFLEGRASRPAATEPVARGVQVQGELRISALYPPGSPMARYRLVDPKADRDRTLAYVEIPQNSTIKIENFVGRYVGVVSYERRLHTASVDPVPIYIASELVLLEPPKTAEAVSKN